MGIIIAVTVAIFFLQAITQVWMGSGIVSNLFALGMDELKGGQIWRLFSYAFVHGGLWHMLGNMIGAYFIGMALQRDIGQKGITLLYFLFALAGGLLFTLVHAGAPINTVLSGASASVLGLLTVYCMSFPDRPITLLLFFILPITVKPKYLLYFTLAINLFGFFFGELAPGGSVAAASVGYSAHLGGMLAAWAVHRWCLSSGYDSAPKRLNIEMPEWVKNKTIVNKQTPNSAYRVNLSSKQAMQQELDRILDKINAKGFGALSAQEKETLTKAKDQLNK